MKKIRKTFVYRLKPTSSQAILFVRFAGAVRYVFNHGLNAIQQSRSNNEKMPTYKQLARMLTQLKKDPDTQWLKEIHSQVLQQSLKNLDRAMQSFFRRCKNKQVPGFPRFKKKGDNDSFRYPQDVTCENGKVYLPKISWINYIDSRPMEGVLKQTTIKRDGKHWFMHFQCEIQKEIVESSPSSQRSIGIDLNLKTLAQASNGTNIPNPCYLKQGLKKLAYTQRQLSRRQRGSNNRRKCAERVATLHRKIRNKRKDYLHKRSTEIVKNQDIICVEDLNIAGMMRNHKLARAIADAGWRIFINFLEYKCAWLNKKFIKIDRFYPSTKTCSSCNAKQDIPLKVRNYECKACGMSIDRDLNASINIRMAGLSILGIP